MNLPKAHQRNIEAAASDWIARRDAGLTAAVSEEFARWRSSDARHAEALLRHERAWEVFDKKISDHRARAMAVRLHRRSRRRRRRAFASAGLVAMIAIAFAAFYRPFTKPTLEATGLAPTTLARVALPKHHLLEDGSRVELKGDAEIAIDFSASLRRVTLRHGEAHFQVAKDAARPFVVAASGVEVRAVGTAFSVGMEAREVQVLVTEGQVSVAPPVIASPVVTTPASPAADMPQAPALVAAGNRVVVELSAPTVSLPIIPVSENEIAERLAWRTPRLEFTGTPLAQAVQLINRYNEIQFVIGDASIGSLEVSGYFRADNVDTFASLIEETLDVKAERQGKTIVLRRSR